MWACGDELTPLGGGLVTSHHLLLIMSLKDANFSADERARLGLGTSEGLIAIIISAPLVGRPIPQLPNPVQPDFVTGERALDSPDPPPISGARTVAESYGFNQVAERNLSGKTVIILPKDASMTSVYAQVVNQCVKSGVHAPPKNGEPKVLVIFNGYWLAVAQSGTLQRSLDRPVRFYAMGPDLQSPISSWTCKPIWETGGLVTFSPTFILRQPTKFQEIMEMIRETPNWAAYITPSSILWFEQSWKIPNRCPDPSKSFAALVAELYFDDHVRQMARSGGGLAVSTVPPQLQRRERCADWLNWLRCVWQCEEWADLVKRCEEYQQRYLQSRVDKDMVLVDVERLGLEDLAGMRIRPHLVPYRRYLYVGQVSLKPQDKAKLGQAVSLCCSLLIVG